jgi:hypothetical protein
MLYSHLVGFEGISIRRTLKDSAVVLNLQACHKMIFLTLAGLHRFFQVIFIFRVVAPTFGPPEKASDGDWPRQMAEHSR